MRIVVAEDSVLLAEGLTRILRAAGHDVTATVTDAGELRRVVSDETDLVVTDVRMPPGHGDDGLRAALEIRSRRTGLPVLVLSQYVASAYARELLDSGGAVGYLLKERVGRVADFLRAIDTVADGGVIVDPEVIGTMLRPSVLDRLTPRETDVLRAMSEGCANAEIASRLSVSDAAVAKHVANIFAKLDLPPQEGNRRVRAILTYLAEH